MTQQQETTRFRFGANWLAFSSHIDAERLNEAIRSLQDAFRCQSFEGRVLLDIGCGSGLFSLAARKLGADVVSIDFDEDSVACAKQLREGNKIPESQWRIHQGSVLDKSLISKLGSADLVYCWGVMHHTGNMQEAIDNVASLVSKSGLLCLSIYNQQGGASKRWLLIKQFYHRLPHWMRSPYVVLIAGFYEVYFALARLAKMKNPLPFSDWQQKKKDRGMSAWHDWVDWIGGLPFEVASPDDVVMQLRPQGLILEQLKTVGKGWGCNEYLFSKE